MSAEASTPTKNRNTRLSRIIAAGFGMPIAHNDQNAAALRAQVCMALRGLRTEHTFEEMRCENARCPTPCSQAVHMQRGGQKRRAEEAAARAELLWRRQGMVRSSSATSDPRADPGTAAVASALLEAGLETSRLGGAAEVVI